MRNAGRRPIRRRWQTDNENKECVENVAKIDPKNRGSFPVMGSFVPVSSCMRFCRSTGVHLPNRLVDYLLYRFALNSSRPAAPRKIPVALKASFVIPAQPVAYPSGGSHEIGGGFAYARFAHIDHVRREHSCSRHGIFLLPACIFEFFPLCFIHVVSENEAIYKVFDLVHFSWNEFLRVAMGASTDHVSCSQGLQRSIRYE